MPELSRRDFVKTAGTGFAAAAMTLAVARPAKAAPSERVRHAILGCGGQGRAHARIFHNLPDCDVVAVCDVDVSHLAQAASELDHSAGIRQVEHFREVLDDKTIDSVSIATPDHWHTPLALLALEAGKHVYVEKPCCHTIEEGRLLQRAATATGKCVQHGTQSRSGEGIRSAVAFLHEGNLGKVRAAKAINHQMRGAIGRAAVSSPPEGVNYDLWTGPAPAHPFTANRWHYNWHWFWDYGTGDMGNDGIHQVDVARWGLGVGAPKSVTASGGQLYYDDDHETPDTQIVVFDFEECQLVYEMRLWTNYPLEGHDNGVVFYGDKGTLEIGRNGCEVTIIGEEKKRLGGGGDIDANMRNFVDCVKRNDPKGLNAPIDEGVASVLLCHLGNIGTRLGKKLAMDGDTIANDAEAKALESKAYRDGYGLPTVGQQPVADVPDREISLL